MIHEGVVVGPFACNCHILADDESKEAVIIDPGDDAEGLLEVVRDLGVTVKALLHTHCHLDHITGTKRLREETGAEIWIHEGDRWLYENLKMQYSETFKLFGLNLGEGEEPFPIDQTFEDGEEVAFGKYKTKVIHTPGHTPGSVCLAVEDAKSRNLFSGDTLFAGSVGRTDLWQGDQELEIESIRTRLLSLDPETVVYPGHGPPTRIEIEKAHNPFVAG